MSQNDTEGSDGNRSSSAQSAMINFSRNGFHAGVETLTYSVMGSHVHRGRDITTPLHDISVEIQKEFAFRGETKRYTDCDIVKLKSCQDAKAGPCFTAEVQPGALNRRITELNVRIIGLAYAAFFAVRVTPKDKYGNEGLPVATSIQSMPSRKYYFDSDAEGGFISSKTSSKNRQCSSYQGEDTTWQCKGGMKYCNRVQFRAPPPDSSKCSLTTDSMPDCILWGITKCKNKNYFVDMALGSAAGKIHDPTCYQPGTVGSRTVLCRLEIPLGMKKINQLTTGYFTHYDDEPKSQTEIDAVVQTEIDAVETCQTPGCSWKKTCCCTTQIESEQNNMTCACSKRKCSTLSFFPAVDTKSACSH